MKKLAVGVDLGGTNLRVALVHPEGRIVEQHKFPTPSQESPERLVDLITEAVCSLSERNSILGLGMGSPGPLSRSKRRIYQTPHLPTLSDFPLGEALEAALQMQVHLEHDSKCAALGERSFGVARGIDEFVLLTFGTGIGGAAVTEGRLVHGMSDGAGEMGHLTLYPNGRECSCGNRGCFEEYVSARALERRASESLGRDVKNPDLLQLVSSGDRAAQNVLNEFCKDVAIGVASLVNIFNPKLFVFAGGLFSSGGGPILSLVSEHLRGRCFASLQKDLKLQASLLSGDAGVLGAASLVFDAQPASHS
jgi:glucokinase